MRWMCEALDVSRGRGVLRLVEATPAAIRYRVARDHGHCTDVFDHIERFYNPRRGHSTLDYLSPREFEQQRRSG
jgi:transposase InsO family protein